MLKQWLSAGLILLAVTLSSGMTAHADSDYTHALATAPQGILLDKTDSVMALGTASTSSAAVVDTTNPTTLGTQAVSLTNGAGKFGSIWSTNDDYFDLNKDETVSLWMYFGNKGIEGGDGLAFVLQNDPAGLAASPTFGRFGIQGETLGVWGVDKNPLQKTREGIAKTAIQNSWALAFDTHANMQADGQAAGQANSFDIGSPNNHAGSNYPGNETAYHQYVDSGLFGMARLNYYYSLRYNGLIMNSKNPGFLGDGQWHHVTVRWNAADGLLNYTFNDKNPETGERQSGIKRSIRLNRKLIDPNNTGRIRWGITGASGSQWSNNLVIFENTPGLVDGTADATLTNLTRGREIQPQGGAVANDQVRLDYHLNYLGGRKSWSDVLAHLRLPKLIEFDTAQISYGDGRAPETLDVGAIKDRELLTKLSYAMDNAYPSATISLTGRIAPVSTTTKVARTSSVFTSNAMIKTAETPAFTVNPSVDLDLDVTSGQALTVKPGRGTTVTGKVTMMTSVATKPAVRIEPILNKQALPTMALNADGQFSLPVTPDMLRPGLNTLTLQAVTADGDKSNRVTVTITVKGELKFDYISPDESFQTSELTGKDQLVHREGSWQIRIQDTRGTGSQWTLLAQTTPFMDSNGVRLGGGPVYVNGRGITPIGATPTPVLTHRTNDANLDGKFNVADNWTRQTGVLLAVDNGTAPGNYTGSITWTLEDAPR